MFAAGCSAVVRFPWYQSTALSLDPSFIELSLIACLGRWQVQTIGAAPCREWISLLILWLRDWFAWTLRTWTYFHAALPEDGEEDGGKRLGSKGS